MKWSREAYENDLRRYEDTKRTLLLLYPEDHPLVRRQQLRIDVVTRILDDPTMADRLACA